MGMDLNEEIDYKAECERLRGLNSALVSSHNALLVSVARAEDRTDALYYEADKIHAVKGLLDRWCATLEQAKANTPGWVTDRSITTLATVINDLDYTLRYHR